MIYSINSIEGRSRINGVKTDVLTFWAGPYGELFNNKKDAQTVAKENRKYFQKSPKYCQLKDIEDIIKKNQQSYDWDCKGLRFLV